MAALVVSGSPATAGRRRPQWRDVIAAEARRLEQTTAVEIDLVIEPGRWVDLDTLAEEVLRGLRDGGRFGRGYAGLDAFVATKRPGRDLGVTVTDATPATLPPHPTPALLAVTAPLPRATREGKGAWRDALAGAWGAQPALEGDVWAAVTIATSRSLLGRLEVILDCLEPVLGRDPRGRDWQAFFPNDDRITWLRVDRAEPAGADAGVRLRLGRVQPPRRPSDRSARG